MLLEVIALTLEDAREAEAGGADRLEVVREIDRDGLTPPAELIRAIRSETRLPLRAMVRESDGFSVRDRHELAALQRAMETFAALDVEGVVVGFARDGSLDVDTTAAVLAAAPGLAVTFHRAFDHVRDPFAAIDAARQLTQVDRILTDGGGGPWPDRCRRLQQYVQHAGDRFTVLAGGGVDAAGLRALASSRAVREAHVGRAGREPQTATAPVSAERVRALRELIDQAEGFQTGAVGDSPERPADAL